MIEELDHIADELESRMLSEFAANYMPLDIIDLWTHVIQHNELGAAIYRIIHE